MSAEEMLVATSVRCKPSRWIATLLLNIAFFSDTFVSPGHSIATDVASRQVLQGWDNGDDGYYANKHAYFELPLKELTKLIPELKKLKPATDQQMLPTILRKTGLRVDDFFHSAVDLIADEDTTENGIYARHRVRDSYLILRKAGGNGVNFNEYREDAEGNRPDQWNADHGFFISSGFAMSCIHFSTAVQSDSVFRYLGEEKIGKQDTYVVAFAQRPGHAAMVVTMRGTDGGTVRLLLQGVAWIDSGSFQIMLMRTDLLASRPEIALLRETTQVDFSEVRLAEVANPLSLPRDVKVDITFRGHNFRNEHHYRNYRLYRVAVKIGPQ